LKILHLLILHSFLKEQGDFLYSGQFLWQVDRYGCTLSLFNIHAILGWWRVARDGMETRRTWRLYCFPHVGLQSCRQLRLSLPPWPRLETDNALSKIWRNDFI
jgi:hypothetical protein